MDKLKLEDLTRIMTDPVSWEITVNGKRIKVKSTNELVSQRRFAKVCLRELTIWPVSIPRKEWDDRLRGLLKECRDARGSDIVSGVRRSRRRPRRIGRTKHSL